MPCQDFVDLVMDVVGAANIRDVKLVFQMLIGDEQYKHSPFCNHTSALGRDLVYMLVFDLFYDRERGLKVKAINFQERMQKLLGNSPMGMTPVCIGGHLGIRTCPRQRYEPRQPK